MPIEALPEYITIVLCEGVDFRWHVYELGTVIKKGDLYSTYNKAMSKGQYWLRTEMGEGRL